MGSNGFTDHARDDMRPRTRVVWAVASTAMTVLSVAAAEFGAWLVAIALAAAVLGLQAGVATTVWRTRRRLKEEVRHLHGSVRANAALLVLTAVRDGNDTTATIADEAGWPGTVALLDELVADGLLTAVWTETTSQPYRLFAVTSAGHAVLSRTIHP